MTMNLREQWRTEGPVRITRQTIEAAWRRRQPGVRLTIRDAACRGLALVVNPGGMSWVFTFKPRGVNPETGRRWATRTVTIGTPESHGPDAARIAANTLKGAVKSGGDPAEERRAKARERAAKAARAKAEAAARDALTTDRMLDAYAIALPARPSLRGHGPISPRHAREELAYLKRAVAQMKVGALPVTEITPGHLRGMLTAEAQRPATARHRFGAFSRFCDWLQGDGHIPVNPCTLVAKAQRRIAVPPRRDFLTLPDLARLWHGAAHLPDVVWRDLARFLIAVPCRRSEAAHMDWSQVDLRGATWTIPAELAKNRDPHRLHLHQAALAILRARWEAAGKPRTGLVFPAPRSGKPVDTFSDMKARIERAVAAELAREAAATGEPPSRLPAWRWHDLRRSFATALAEAGIPEAVADAILNHRQSATRGGVLGVYQRAQRWPEQKAAMARWGALLEAAITGKDAPAADVLPFPGAARA
jgi:integrase